MTNHTDLIQADDVEPEAVEWRWRQRIPKAMISTVAGRPDQGKGLFATLVAAEVSQTEKVLYSAAEDSRSLITRPRLEAAGAKLENVLLWEFRIPESQSELHRLIVEHEIGLVVMDPFASHLSGGVHRHSDNVRTVLGPLTRTIETTGTSVLIIEHALRRAPLSGHPLDAIGGSSSGLPAASRTAFVLGIDPDDDERRILCPAKFNIGPKPKAIAFEIDVQDIADVGDIPFLEVDEELEAFDPMRLLAYDKKSNKVGRPPDKRAAACQWVTNYLAKNGVTKAGKVQEDAKQYGMTPKTLRRAVEDMGIVKNPPGGGRNCTWDLPDDVKDMMGIAKTPPPPPPADTEDEGPGPEDVDSLIDQLLGGTNEEDSKDA